MPTHLPVIQDDLLKGSLRGDGSRDWVHPADVSGRFAVIRRVLFVVLIGIWVALPLVQIKGRPAVFLDVVHRHFFLFGATFNAQDIWIVFFLLTGIAFALAYMTMLVGRVWCGYACPQTVFMEGVFRRIERLIEGPRERRLALNRAPWDAKKVAKKSLKHVLFFLAAAGVAHIFVSYFVSVPALFAMMRKDPGQHPEAFAWAGAMTVIFYGNFAFFREQLCLAICPYGRLQSLLVDESTKNIGYDKERGEPRGKAKKTEVAENAAPLGDCVDCKRCIAVCPTGIDIRNGLQLDCIACSACVDACDDIMLKLDRKPGLIRYDSQLAFEGKAAPVLRPRLYVYTVLGIVGLVVAFLTIGTRADFEATLLRLPGPPYVIESGVIRNGFQVHVVNKEPTAAVFLVDPEPVHGVVFLVAQPKISLPALGAANVPVFVTTEASNRRGDIPFVVLVRREALTGDQKVLRLTGKFLGPSASMPLTGQVP